MLREVFNANTVKDIDELIKLIESKYEKMCIRDRNYNSSANKDDGTCEYYVLGCKNPSADNYDPKAEIDDGSCIISTSKNIEDNDSERCV